MSHTTATVHVRGIRLRRLLDAVMQRMRQQGYRETAAADAERQLLIRKEGAWCTLVDTAGQEAELEAWGEDLSRLLGRSVLTLWTSDVEPCLVATRWKHGARRSRLDLPDDAYRDQHSSPRAPARVLWPWFAPTRRSTILRAGVALASPLGGATGDAELDALLDDLQEEEEEATPINDIEEDEDFVDVDQNVALASVGATVGLRPWLDPRNPGPRTRVLSFRRPRPKPDRSSAARST